MTQKVKVVAPSDMEAGYEFTAEVDGKTVGYTVIIVSCRRSNVH